jgi:prepilin-type processing-associated H-X9-DG protein
MDTADPSPQPRSEPISFSLGTLFLIVSCIGVALVAFRISERGRFEIKLSLATVLVSAFLTLWFFITQQIKAMSAAVVLCIFGLLFAMLLPAVISGSGPCRAPCANNLHQIGLALLSYHQTYGSFPPAYVADANGKPLYSWRVLILPFLDQANLAQTIHMDEPWDSPNNAKSTQLCLVLFNCPDDPQNAGGLSNLTGYLAVVGPHTAWSGATPRKLSDFKDPSKTILLVEVADSGIHWAEPRDLYVGQMSAGINPKVGQGISSGHPGGAVTVLFADGAVQFLPADTDPKKLAELLDLDGGTTN